MLTQINGIHHITAIADDANVNNAFYTHALGLRRVKKTVNFDAPDVYHLYYGTGQGRPGTAMTYFPFSGARRGSPGTGEVATTLFSVPDGTLDAWQARLEATKTEGIVRARTFGEDRLHFRGPDGEGLALVAAAGDERAPWLGSEVPAGIAIRGFHGARLCLRDGAATADLLVFMGFEERESEDGVRRFAMAGGNGADVVEIEERADLPPAQQGAGSVHHIAFAVADRDAQLAVREAIADTGVSITPVIDRDYFWSVYFRTPGGVLFEIATEEPGFARDEEPDHLGEALKLPAQHEHLRERLERSLAPIED